MRISEIFEDLGIVRKKVWSVRDGNVTRKEVSALASPIAALTSRNRVEPTDETEDNRG